LAKGDIAQWGCHMHIHHGVSHIAKLVPGLHLGPHFGGRGGHTRVAMAPFKRATVFSCRLSTVTTELFLNIRLQFAIKYLQHANQHGVDHFAEERVGQCKPNFNTIWERHRVIIFKRNRVGIFCRLSTMHECDRLTNHGTVTLIPIGKIASAMSPT